MANAEVTGVRITCITAAVPGEKREISETTSLDSEETLRISQNTGILRRHIAGGNICTSDLCLAAANRLLEATGWSPDSIDALIFVSQTPDYILPATACSLQGRLGLSSKCAAFDVNLGCSGYVYGLWLAGSLMRNSSLGRVILLAGDTISRIASPEDRSVSMLFGDAGTATALEVDPAAHPMFFEMGTDGTGASHLMVKAGGFRNPATAETSRRSERDPGNIRSDEDLYMDGGEIMAFTLNRVPEMCRALMAQAGWTIDSIDAFVPHQANRFMIQNLARLMRVPKEKLAMSLENYGNTSSASIPMTLIDVLSNRLERSGVKILLAGFGVGFSWAAAAVELGPMALPPVIIL